MISLRQNLLTYAFLRFIIVKTVFLYKVFENTNTLTNVLFLMQGWIGLEYKPATNTKDGLQWIKDFNIEI